MPRLSHVIYTFDSGSILPELQRHDEIIIHRRQVELRRNGKTPDTRVRAGHWQLAADEAALDALFAQLEGVDCSKLRRVEPLDAPDGGPTIRYTLVYASGKTCALIFDPGVTYTGGEAVTGPVEAFIRGLKLPPEMG